MTGSQARDVRRLGLRFVLGLPRDDHRLLALEFSAPLGQRGHRRGAGRRWAAASSAHAPVQSLFARQARGQLPKRA